MNLQEEAKKYAEKVCNGQFPITYTREQVVKHTNDDFIAGADFYKENSIHPINFGRWLLKYAKEDYDEGLLCWKYEGKFYNTDELYEEFCRQQ